MSHAPITSTAFQDFKAGLHGELIGPDSANYESTRRVWNGMVDKHPALIVRCAGTSDVIKSVQFARSQNLTVAG